MNARRHNEVNLDWLTVLAGPLMLLLLLALGVEGKPAPAVQDLPSATVTTNAPGNAPSGVPKRARTAEH